MPSANKVILMGNLTRDPELKHASTGTEVCEFGLAVNRKKKQGDKQIDEVCFVNIACFSTLAQNCNQYLSKGSLVYLEGRLNFSQWDDKNSGQKRSKLDVVAENVQFMPKNEAKEDNQNDIPF